MTDALSPSTPRIGDLAPDFSLSDDRGTVRTLSEQRGQWLVLYFYPKDDTPGCATEACEFRDTYASFQATGADVWGISVLGSGSKASFKEKFGLPFALIADEQHEVAERYGVWVEKQNYGKTYMGIGRATFLIDPEGRVAQAWHKVKPEGHAEVVLAALEAAKAAT